MNTNNDKISIIIPAYNVQDYISQCLENLINQTYKNLEIIIVNDGSNDNTSNIINEFANIDKRIVIINQENQGLSESRNNAMNIATGNYIMFVDADDWIEKDTCEICYNVIKTENADLILFSYIREYKDRSLIKSQFDMPKIVFEEDDVKYKLQRRIFGPYEEYEISHPEKLDCLSTAWGKLYKSDIIKKYAFKSFKEIGATCEDVFFNIEILADVHKAVFIDKNMYHYRKYNVNSLSKLVDPNVYQKWKTAYVCLKKIIKEKNYDNTYSYALNNRFSINLIGIGLRIVSSADRFKVKYNMLKSVLNDETYVNTISTLKYKKMAFHWRFFYWNAKHKNILMILFLLKCISFLASKK